MWVHEQQHRRILHSADHLLLRPEYPQRRFCTCFFAVLRCWSETCCNNSVQSLTQTSVLLNAKPACGLQTTRLKLTFSNRSVTCTFESGLDFRALAETAGITVDDAENKALISKLQENLDANARKAGRTATDFKHDRTDQIAPQTRPSLWCIRGARRDAGVVTYRQLI